MNATGRVNRPKRIKMPPIPIWDNNEAVPPFGGIPIGKAKSFTVPARMNMIAAMMRSMLCKYGLHACHLATRVNSFLLLPFSILLVPSIALFRFIFYWV
jgi:hypothetical protein